MRALVLLALLVEAVYGRRMHHTSKQMLRTCACMPKEPDCEGDTKIIAERP